MQWHGWLGLGIITAAEAPVLGDLGFPPFALECYAMYHWLLGALGGGAPARSAML